MVAQSETSPPAGPRRRGRPRSLSPFKAPEPTPGTLIGTREAAAEQSELGQIRDELRRLGDLIEKLIGQQAQPHRDAMLSVREAAKILNVSRDAVYRLLQDGKIRFTAVGRGRGAKRIRPDELTAYQRRESQAGPAKHRVVTPEMLLAV